MPQISVTIAGKAFRMACDPGEEERLHRLAAEFDAAIEGFRAEFGEIGDLRLIVMAGLLTVDRWQEAERAVQAAHAEMCAATSALAEQARREDAVVQALDTLVQRIENAARALERRPADTQERPSGAEPPACA